MKRLIAAFTLGYTIGVYRMAIISWFLHLPMVKRYMFLRFIDGIWYRVIN